MIASDYVLERKYRTQNNRRFDDNQKHLRELITTMKEFSEDELLFELSKNGDVVIDTEDSVNDFLQQLVDTGLLRYRFGKYSMRIE
ncbi:MAG: hypothetical protein GYA15_07230 [Leptolinea sp.]|jgi:hypothetical protein|nr:hypothetical protein [Leptolinea sp.]